MPVPDKNDWGLNTAGIHGADEDNPTSAISTPIFQSATFQFESSSEIAAAMAAPAHPQFYGRYATPNTKHVESVIANLEGGESGLAVSSGMAAISLVLMNRLAQGDHLVSQRNIYPTTYNFIRKKLPRMGIEITFVDQGDNDGFARAIRDNTRLIYVESPSNPILQLTDLTFVTELASAHKLLTVVDNTFATPFNQKPLHLGCDIVVHSATKYLSGHSDVVAGIVVSNREMMEQLWKDHILFGPVLHPFEAWLLGRGLKTFGIRMERHNANAMEVAQFLSNHPRVEQVHYPGLRTHPQHGLASRQMPGGYGGMVSFVLKGGQNAAQRFLEKLQLVTLAVSLGGVHSLISHPQSTISSVQTEEIRSTMGVSGGLLRMSVGLEDSVDILADLDGALVQI